MCDSVPLTSCTVVSGVLLTQTKREVQQVLEKEYNKVDSQTKEKLTKLAGQCTMRFLFIIYMHAHTHTHTHTHTHSHTHTHRLPTLSS